MVIRPEQMASLTNGFTFRKVRLFLAERARLPELQTALARDPAIHPLWTRILHRFPLSSEYRTAIVLSYAFVRHTLGHDAEQDTALLLAGPDPEFAAKTYFETTGVFRFSEFDMAPEVSRGK